ARPPQKIAPDDEADAVSFPTPIYPQDAIPVLQRMGREGGFPAADMTQFGAKQYTKWLTTITGQVFRLPTEGEWEYACRAGTTTAFFFGDDAEKLGDYAWHFDNSEWEDGEHGHPDSDQGYRKVGEKKPNPWGLHDILGNVSEWVVDQYAADHYAKIAAKGPLSAVDAAAWPTKVYPRIIRGGHWDSDPEDCRSAARLASEKDWKIQDPQLPKSVWYHTEAWWAGFRLVRPLRTPDSKVLAQFWDADVQGIRDVLKLDKQRRADVKTIRSLIKPAE
ncbi:MAG: formylglycine-generating enzyme family protein, partial [Phycisphaerae bacterium]|nr:formylglycine-generating enzyme family protein [Phycisphaerae bacterium]